MRIDRYSFAQLLQPSAFQWLAGIEDTFITAPSPRTGRMLDEYELTQHYERWGEDLELFAALEVPMVRYGIPWHRVNPGPGSWDFSWIDGPLERLLALGIQPVVDLVHYGVPGWIGGACLASDFPQHMAEYAARVADRYRGRIHFYTPLSEPRVNAWYCGKLGWWPPCRRGWRGFVEVLLALCRGIVLTAHALRAVDPAIVLAHVDAADLYSAGALDLELEAYRRQELVFLALDLIGGKVRPGHALYEWLLLNGAVRPQLAWFEAHAIELDLIGLNLFPRFSDKRLVRTHAGVRIRMPYASAAIVERLADAYWTRYRRPLFISETGSEGSVERRLAWLDASVEATARVRARGVPLVGYTWWPLYALVTWAYREGRGNPESYLRQMGLWDLAPGPLGLERVSTRLVERYRKLIVRGAASVGSIGGVATAPKGAHVG